MGSLLLTRSKVTVLLPTTDLEHVTSLLQMNSKIIKKGQLMPTYPEFRAVTVDVTGFPEWIHKCLVSMSSLKGFVIPSFKEMYKTECIKLWNHLTYHIFMYNYIDT